MAKVGQVNPPWAENPEITGEFVGVFALGAKVMEIYFEVYYIFDVLPAVGGKRCVNQSKMVMCC